MKRIIQVKVVTWLGWWLFLILISQVSILAFDGDKDGTVKLRGDDDELYQKLESMMISESTFDNAPLHAVVEFFVSETIKQDPAHKGVPLRIEFPRDANKKISFNL